MNASVATLTGSVNSIQADDITVTPVDGPDGPSFTFSANWGTSSGALGTGTYAGLLYFRGTATSPGTALLQSNSLNVDGSVTASLLGNALAAVAEINCVGNLLDIGSIPPGCNLPGIGVQAQAGAVAGPLATVGALLDLLTNGGLANLIDPLTLAASAQLLYPNATDTVDVFKLVTVLATNTLGTPEASANINSFTQDFTSSQVEPVPEPSTWVMAGVGLLLVAGHRIRLRG